MKLKIAKDELEFDQKPTLNKNFWDGEKLNPEVKDAIMAVVESFLESTNLEMGIDDVDEIEFTGSLANYNYSKLSDVDIHLLFDFSKLGKDPDFMRELLTAKAIIWNDRNNVTLFGHEVELYITAAGTDHHSTGVYSIKNDEWLVKPVRDSKLSAELNLNKVKDKADKISKEIDMLVVKDELSFEKLEKLKDKIKKMRVAGLETGGEHSTENLAFKLLRRRGELNTLYALMQQAKDEELSLDEDMEWWKKRRSLDNKNYRELMGYVGGKGVFKRKYASKNIGYPKSVSRKKLSKLGAPYMMDPPSKLPKSGPPGVGSLEEETVIKEISVAVKEIFDDVMDRLLSNESVIMKLPKRSISGLNCLGPHSYEIKRILGSTNYKIKLQQKVNDIISPIAKELVAVNELKPLEKCVYFKGDATISESELRNVIIDEIVNNNARFVFEAPKFAGIDFSLDLPSLPTFEKDVSQLSKKLMREKGEIELVLKSIEPVRFTNMPDTLVLLEAAFNGVKKHLKDKKGEIDLLKLADFSKLYNIIKNSVVSKFPTKIDYVYYNPDKKPPNYYVKFSGNAAATERDSIIPIAYFNSAIDDAVRSMPKGNYVEERTKIIFATLLKNFLKKATKSRITKTFSKKELLENIDDETDGEFCKYFDCKVSKVFKIINGRRSQPITIKQYLKGQKFKEVPEPEELFLKQLDRDNATPFDDLTDYEIWKGRENQYVKVGEPKKTRLYGGVYQALFVMINQKVKSRKVANKLIQKGVKSLAKDFIPTVNTYATKVQDTYKNNCKGATLGNIKNNKILKNMLPYLDKAKREGDESVSIKCDDGTIESVEIPRSMFIGSPFDTGLMIKVKPEIQTLLSDEWKKYGFQNFDPEDNTKWYMPKEIADQWKVYDPTKMLLSKELEDGREVTINISPTRTIKIKCDNKEIKKLKGGNTPKSIAYIVCKQGLDYSIDPKKKSRSNVTIDQDWKTKNLTRVKLGDKTVYFNKQFAKKLQDAYKEAITESGLEDFGFIPQSYNPRRIGSKETDPLSTHALGTGIDFYVPAKTFSNKLGWWKETQFAMGMGDRNYEDIAKENKFNVTKEMKEKILDFRKKYKKFVDAMKRNGFRAGADFTRDSKFGDPSHFEVSIEKLLN